MTDIYSALASALVDLEQQLHINRLWASQAPSPEALASQQPFCIDTLSFEQWLQYVFLPRMRLLINERRELPRECAIAPMAEQAFAGEGVACAGVIASLARVDLLITEWVLQQSLT